MELWSVNDAGLEKREEREDKINGRNK